MSTWILTVSIYSMLGIYKYRIGGKIIEIYIYIYVVYYKESW